MTGKSVLPGARAALVDKQGVMTPQFYRFLQTLSDAQAGNASASDIAAINAQLATLQAEIDALPEGGGYPKLQVAYPILSQGLLQNGFAKLAMDQPDDSGTGSLLAFVKDAWGRITGTKAATITGTAGRVTVANGDASAGLPTIDLATVADTGGGSLLRFVRDAWGRITGTSTPSTTDLAEGSNLYYTDTRADARITLQKGQPSGLATLDTGGKLDAGQLPALAITETFVVNSQAAMLALVAEEGDVAVRTDQNKSYILTAAPASTLANWQELLSPSSAVASVFGRVGAVTAASGDYTFAQIGSTPTTLAGYGITDAVPVNSVRRAVFTTSGSFTVPASITTLFVSACAGGGGGGGGGSTLSTDGQPGGGGGGGGAGQNIQKQSYTVTPGAALPITVGAAGTGGASGVVGGASGNNGTAGGSTSVGSLVSLAGGGGGLGGNGSAGFGGGQIGGAGYPSGGYGMDGAVGGFGGTGASCPFGGGGLAGRGAQGTAISGAPSAGYGSGGGGGGADYLKNQNSTSTGGGNGSPGIVIIEW